MMELTQLKQERLIRDIKLLLKEAVLIKFWCVYLQRWKALFPYFLGAIVLQSFFFFILANFYIKSGWYQPKPLCKQIW